jgi:hypothetical protein
MWIMKYTWENEDDILFLLKEYLDWKGAWSKKYNPTRLELKCLDGSTRVLYRGSYVCGKEDRELIIISVKGKGNS